MTRARIPSAIARTLFAIIFVAGCIIHLVMGRTWPEGYAAFGTTAWTPLANLWSSFVMPNIAWLTVAMALIELTFAVGLFLGGRAARFGAGGACIFFTFLMLLGFAVPQPSSLEDFLMNRLGSLIMILAILPILLYADPRNLLATWKSFFAKSPSPNESQLAPPFAASR